MAYQDNPFQKNLEMWQEFGDKYMQNMMSMFEQNMESSQAFQKQMQDAVGQVVNSQFDMIMAGLKSVQDQMAEMNKMMASMMPEQPAAKSAKK